MLGRLIANRYLIEDQCERTACGLSFRAYHLAIDRSVLLRILPARAGLTREACRRALAAAEKVAALPTPHVTATLDVGLVSGRWPFVVSDYSNGRTLGAVLRQSGPLDVPRLLAIARQLTGALQLAHAAGVVHGGLSLDNLWIESRESVPDWLRVMGFGLSELPGSEPGAPTSGVFVSSVSRGAGPVVPRASGAVRADIYAVGVSLYELASGSRPPFAHTDVAEILDSELIGAGWSGRRAVLRAFAMLVQRCLYLSPTTNYESMAEVSRDLDSLEHAAGSIAAAVPGGGPPVTVVHAPARRARAQLSEPKVIVRG
jgi:serine/threonine-protein kinase